VYCCAQIEKHGVEVIGLIAGPACGNAEDKVESNNMKTNYAAHETLVE